VKLPLGPAFGQCCGGHVTLLIEHWDTARLNGLPEDLFARALPGEPREMPLVLRRQIADQRSQGLEPAFFFGAGWIAEPIAAEAQSLWIYGAGHVGRALVSVLAPLPEIQITWVDTGSDRFPDEIPNGVVPLVSRNPADVVCHAPNDADHLILTYSHAFDLELCHQLLVHGFRSAGLIGSETKWARFQSRLSQLGHPSADILRIACPIGDPSLGKHPQAIAVGVANAILRQTMEISAARGMRA
jgi:xanthine dehydrogenase accessory factor